MGILFWLLKWHVFASAAFALAGVVLVVLWILVAIELHQDKVLNEIAMHENEEQEQHGKYRLALTNSCNQT